jgi:peptide/nickel transport system ATP-binding protein
MMGKAMLGLLPAPHVCVVGGQMLFEGRDLAALDEDAMREVRGAGSR